MNTIGIITFHFAENVGASLQCVALCNYIKNNGGNCIVVNYRPQYHTSKYSIFINPAEAFKVEGNIGAKLRCFIKRIGTNLYFLNRVNKKYKFRKFLEQNCKQSKIALNRRDLENICMNYSACIAGSDQIWNENYTNQQFDGAYFLDFFSGAKYTYGASVGHLLNTEQMEEVKTRLYTFKKVSVREKSLEAQLIEHDIKNVEISVDPTFLVDETYWENMLLHNGKKEKYVLVYQLEKSSAILEIVSKLQEKTGLKVINISPNDFLKGTSVKEKRIKDCGPQEFLTYIHNADYIVTNSFHGTVFSIIFRKNFGCVLHSKNPERMKTLLSDCHLMNRIYTDYNDAILEDINYKMVNEVYLPKINKSREYVLSIIREVKRKDESAESK